MYHAAPTRRGSLEALADALRGEATGKSGISTASAPPLLARKSEVLATLDFRGVVFYGAADGPRHDISHQLVARKVRRSLPTHPCLKSPRVDSGTVVKALWSRRVVACDRRFRPRGIVVELSARIRLPVAQLFPLPVSSLFRWVA